MLAFGMPYDATKEWPAKKEDREHAKGSWVRFESYRNGHARGTGYLLPVNNPFENWDVSDRYANESNFDQERAITHQAGAIVVCELIKKARREGLLI